MPATSPARYLVALGGNRRTRHGTPAQTLRAAAHAIDAVRLSPIVVTDPLGPSARRFANAVAVIDSDEPPTVLLARLQAVERAFGRRSGQRWGARPIDLDIILWSAGPWNTARLTVPHRAFRARRFVLDPAVALVPEWRDPSSGLTIRQLHARLTRRRPLPRLARAVGP